MAYRGTEIVIATVQPFQRMDAIYRPPGLQLRRLAKGIPGTLEHQQRADKVRQMVGSPTPGFTRWMERVAVTYHSPHIDRRVGCQYRGHTAPHRFTAKNNVGARPKLMPRSEEHTSELQSRPHL